MKRKHSQLTIIIYTFCSSLFIQAQNIDTVYHTNNSSLTYHTINTVITDKAQNVWIGTEYGLNLLNADGWQNWFTETSNLHDNAIRSFGLDFDNSLWIGGFQNDLSNFSFLKNDTIYLHEKPAELSSFIRDILFVETDSTKMMFLATSSSLGIYSFNDEYWQFYNFATSPYLRSQHFTSLAYDASKGIYAGTLNGGLFNLKNNGNIRVLFGEETGLPDNTILDVAVDGNGLVWLATPEGGLVSYDDNTFESINPDNKPGFPTRSISSIAISTKNDIWCGTLDAGIVLLNIEGLVKFNIENSTLLSNKINDLHLQNDTLIWAATDNGLAKICTSNKTVSSNFLFPVHKVDAVYPNPSNGNLILTQKHLILRISVYNTTGSLVYDTFNPTQNINLSYLQNGSYLLNIQTENAVYVQKILIFY